MHATPPAQLFGDRLCRQELLFETSLRPFAQIEIEILLYGREVFRRHAVGAGSTTARPA